MAGKLGRRPAVFTRRSVAGASLMRASLTRLGAPPSASVDRVSAIPAWGQMGNDELGDCTCADTAHALMLRTAATGTPIVPTDEQVIALYSAVSGYVPGNPSTDCGAVEADICAYLKQNGFLGHKSDNWVNLDPADLDGLRWSIELFGTCRLGLNLPNSAIDQFNAGQPWDVVASDDGSAGGHDVPLVRYDDDNFWCVTWGRLQPIKAAFLRQYLEEAHAELYFDWIAANGRSPGGLDLATLASDLNAIS